jgi:cysteine desulfurase family protein
VTSRSRATIYLDHAATSWPKPPEVLDAVAEALTDSGGNPGRAAHRLALAAGRLVHAARRDLAALLGVRDARNLLFQPGCTQAMNLVLFGLLSPGDRVVTTSVEHNAVSRPLTALRDRGVEIVVVRADDWGIVGADEIAEALSGGGARAVVCQHASNLNGAIQPVEQIARAARAAGALTLVDGAQAGGHLEVDLTRLGVDAWACSGHKGLLGPQGAGVLFLADGCTPEPLVYGGTGAGRSEDAGQPLERPERYEAGTPNTPGIAGMGAAARLLLAIGAEQRALEGRLATRLHEGILTIGGFRVLGPPLGVARVPIVSVVHERVDADRLASALDERWGIATRAGLHCSPWAHESAGTLGTGALRFGLGWGSTEEGVDTVLEALAELVGSAS